MGKRIQSDMVLLSTHQVLGTPILKRLQLSLLQALENQEEEEEEEEEEEGRSRRRSRE